MYVFFYILLDMFMRWKTGKELNQCFMDLHYLNGYTSNEVFMKLFLKSSNFTTEYQNLLTYQKYEVHGNNERH